MLFVKFLTSTFDKKVFVSHNRRPQAIGGALTSYMLDVQLGGFKVLTETTSTQYIHGPMGMWAM